MEYDVTHVGTVALGIFCLLGCIQYPRIAMRISGLITLVCFLAPEWATRILGVILCTAIIMYYLLAFLTLCKEDNKYD